jgi:hypothetical protein
MAEHALGTRAEVLEQLSGVAKGRRSIGLESFSGPQLSDPVDRAIVLPMVAILDLDTSVSRHESAVEAADQAGDIALQIRTRLELESELRAQHEVDRSRQIRDELLARFNTPGMKAEMAARSMLAGQTGQGFPEAPESDMVKLWTGLSSGADAPITTESPLTKAVALWTKGRSYLREGSPSYSQYASALSSIPLHRQGGFSAGTVLDGSQGLPYQLELKNISGSTSKEHIGTGLVLHEIFHRLELNRLDLSTGRVQSYALHLSARMDLLGAAAQSRVAVERWLSGVGDYPLAAFTALERAENHIKQHVSDEASGVVGYEQTFHKLMPAPGWDIIKLKERLKEQSVAVISYQQFGSRIHGIAISTYGAFSGDLASAKLVRKYARDHARGLKVKDVGGRSLDMTGISAVGSPVLAGHLLREAIYDPLEVAFLPDGGDGGIKVGKYLVVAPRFINSFNFGSLPENSAGTVVLGFKKGAFYMHSTLGTRDHNNRDLAMVTRPAFLGATLPGQSSETVREDGVELSDADLVAMSRKGLNIPPDMSKAKARFPEENSHILANEEMTRAGWFEWMRGAKYIYLSDFEKGPNAEFVVRDGMIGLDEIRTSPMRAELVIISSEASTEEQVARANAFLEAGARNVMVIGWEIPDAVVENVIPEVLSSTTKDEATGDTVALVVKKVLASGSDASEKKFGVIDAETRGAFLLYGAL